MVSKYVKTKETQHTEKQSKAFSDYANMQHEDIKGCNNADAIAHFTETDSMKKANVVKKIKESVYNTVENIWRKMEYCLSVVRNNFWKCVFYAHFIASPCLHLYLTIFTFTYQSDDIDCMWQMYAGRFCTIFFWFTYGFLHSINLGPDCELFYVFVNTLWLNLGSLLMIISLCTLKENISPKIENPGNYTSS